MITNRVVFDIYTLLIAPYALDYTSVASCYMCGFSNMPPCKTGERGIKVYVFIF